MERRSGASRNPKHADSSSSALNMVQQLQGISAGGSGSGSGSSSRASSTHPITMSAAPNPINPTNIINSSDGGSSTIANDGSSSRRSTSTKRTSFLREQDQYMPIANVVRIMRRVLPPHAKISDDAKETVQECVSEYISFITGEANDKCQREQRKTITAEDVISAMGKLGFDDYVPSLTLFLDRYRDQDRTSTAPRTTTVPTEIYPYAPNPVPNPNPNPNPPTLPPMVPNSNSLYFDYGPGQNSQSMNMMTLPQGSPGPTLPTLPSYGPGIGFQQGLNNPGMFDSLGLSGFYGNPPGAGPSGSGGSSSQNAGPGPSFDPFAQFYSSDLYKRGDNI